MRICSNCGSKMHDTDLFCTACGQKYTEPEELNSVTAEEILNDAENQLAQDTTPENVEPEETSKEEVATEQTTDVTDDTIEYDTAEITEATAQTTEADVEPEVETEPEAEPIKEAAPLIIGPDSAQQSTQRQDEQKAKAAPMYKAINNSSYPQQENEPVKMGEWMLNMIVLSIPIVNIVMAFVWAFGKESKLSLKNFSRAWLIWALVISVIIILFIVIIGFALYSSFGNFYSTPQYGGHYIYY